MIGAGEVARMLGERVDQLVLDLLPAGHREGDEWRCGSVSGEPGHSLGVHMVGPRSGVWADFAGGDRGDALDLVRRVLELDVPDAIRWARTWLGLGDDGEVPWPKRRTSKPAKLQGGDTAKERQQRALDIWREAVFDIGSTPAEGYLRGRGLDPARLYSLHGAGRWPATLRYHAYRDREYAALIVAVHGTDCGLVRAIQRVLLQPDGSAVRDDRGRRTKLSLGPIGGNAAMFDYWPDPQGRWGLAEGPESALAAFVLTGIPTWAAISAGNMRRIRPPSWARHATIFADRDETGLSAAGETARLLKQHPRIETVRIAAATVDGSDALDVLDIAHA